ncbi:hypothetical protein SH2C18_06480 [Clostridium sediminicola]|uniref:methyl-accepting chemotaxis protein n=1 Tax=Clostridium sediminicola TaxID=3114879 RepID=UPI0031F21606
MKSIRGKFVLVIISIVIIISIIISSSSLYLIYKNNNDRLTQLEKDLRVSYDQNIKQQVEIIVSQLDGIKNTIKKGILTEEEGKIVAADIIRNARYGKNGYFFVDTLNGINVVLLGNKDVEGKSRINLEDKMKNKIIQNFIQIAKDKGDGYTDYYFPKNGENIPLPKRAYVKLYEPFGWVIGTGNYIDDIDAFIQNEEDIIAKQYKNTVILLSIILVSSIIIGYIVAFLVSKSISKPIQNLLASANSIADGNLDISININRSDELGSLAKAFTVMVNNMNNVISNINSASNQVAAGARQVSHSSISLSQGATEQASSIEQLTASIEEITSQTKQNAKNADEVKNITQSVKTNVTEGYSQMNYMLDAMTEINNSSKNISKIIKVIDEIAFQTNILALNAAVEAARAGQHGKGFAVVAEEVRNLAARSANAAKETTTLIEGSIKKVEDGTKIADITAEALKKVVTGVDESAHLVTEIAVSTREQSIGLDQINTGINQIASVVQATSATSEESAAASEELSGQAETLKNQVNTFILKNLSQPASNVSIENSNPKDLNFPEKKNEINDIDMEKY